MLTNHWRTIRYVTALATLLLIGMLPVGAFGSSASTPMPTVAPSPIGLTGVPDYWPTTAWRTASPEAQGMDSGKLADALHYADTAQLNLRSLTVIRNGSIVLDAANQPFTTGDQVPVYSVTKSVISLLVGIAQRDGFLPSLNQPVFSFFPGRSIAHPDPRKQAITVEDLLTMRSGLDCADDKIGSTIEGNGDWVQSILDLPMANQPGSTFAYCSRNTHLLSVILTKVTGMNTSAYAQSRLFDPLGIKPGDVSWQTDPQGIAIGGYGLALRPHDMAKLGLLLLAHGQWSGTQVVPAEWIATATQAHVTLQTGKDYGYLFWVYPNRFAAEGLGDQWITVVPNKNLIVVITAAHSGGNNDAMQSLVADDIVPAVTSNGPLSANPTAAKALEAQVARMENPVQPVPALPVVAAAISGRTFQLSANTVDWKSLSVTFTAGSATAQATVVTSAGDQRVTIGMDHVYRLNAQAGGGQIALRGSWVDDHTFVVHQLVMGDLREYEIRFEFTGNQVAVHLRETVFGQESADFTGTAT